MTPGALRIGATLPAVGYTGMQPREPVTSPPPAPPAGGAPASQPPRPPDTDYYPWSQTQDFKPRDPVRPLDLGPPLAPWYADGPAAPPRTVMPGPGATRPGPSGGPTLTDERPPEPVPVREPSPPVPAGEERIRQSSGALAGKGEVSNPTGKGSGRVAHRGMSPGRTPPLRGPAAAVLAWRRSGSARGWRGRSAGVPGPGQKVGGIGGLAQGIGRGAGFTPSALAGDA